MADSSMYNRVLVCHIKRWRF